jgi:hypothetical protein
MFLQPLFVLEKGFLPSVPLPEPILRLLPAFLAFFVICFLMFKMGKKIDWKEEKVSSFLIFSFGWMTITVLPFLFHPLTFPHVSRYLYYPQAGFCLLAGRITSLFLETCRKEGWRGGAVSGALLFVCVLLLNIQTAAYHFKRYRSYISENQEEDYSVRVRQLLVDGTFNESDDLWRPGRSRL